MLRGWEVSTADVEDGNFSLAESGGFIRYTVPETYVAGQTIFLHINGGLSPDAPGNPFPSSVSCVLRAEMLLADEEPGVPDVVPLSATGYTWAIGTSWRTWTSQADGSWGDEGENDEVIASLIPSRFNTPYTLIDGAGGSPSLPGEGCFVNETAGMQPYGAFPVNVSGLAFETQSPSAGQEVGLFVSLQTVPNDDENRDAKCFAYIDSIVVEAAGVFTELDLTDFTVGFGPGSAGNAWTLPPPLPVFYGRPWNPHRSIEGFRPPQTFTATPDLGYQDLWLVETEDVVDATAGFNGAGYLNLTVRSFECQTDSETTWECATPEADAWACATSEDDEWACVGDAVDVGYGVLLDINGDYLTYINGGRIKLI